MEAARRILGTTERSEQDRMLGGSSSASRRGHTDPEGDGRASRPASAGPSTSRLQGCSTPPAGYSAPTGHHHNSLRRDQNKSVQMFMQTPQHEISSSLIFRDPENRK